MPRTSGLVNFGAPAASGVGAPSRLPQGCRVPKLSAIQPPATRAIELERRRHTPGEVEAGPVRTVPGCGRLRGRADRERVQAAERVEHVAPGAVRQDGHATGEILAEPVRAVRHRRRPRIVADLERVETAEPVEDVPARPVGHHRDATHDVPTRPVRPATRRRWVRALREPVQTAERVDDVAAALRPVLRDTAHDVPAGPVRAAHDRADAHDLAQPVELGAVARATEERDVAGVRVERAAATTATGARRERRVVPAATTATAEHSGTTAATADPAVAERTRPAAVGDGALLAAGCSRRATRVEGALLPTGRSPGLGVHPVAIAVAAGPADGPTTRTAATGRLDQRLAVEPPGTHPTAGAAALAVDDTRATVAARPAIRRRAAGRHGVAICTRTLALATDQRLDPRPERQHVGRDCHRTGATGAADGVLTAVGAVRVEREAGCAHNLEPAGTAVDVLDDVRDVGGQCGDRGVAQLVPAGQDADRTVVPLRRADRRRDEQRGEHRRSERESLPVPRASRPVHAQPFIRMSQQRTGLPRGFRERFCHRRVHEE